MSRKSKSRPRNTGPLWKTMLTFRRKGTGYMKFAGGIFLAAGIAAYILKSEMGPAGWTNRQVLATVLAIAIQGLLVLLYGFNYYTRATEILISREEVIARTKSFFMRKIRERRTPMKDYEGVASVIMKNMTSPRYQVILCHRDTAQSVVLYGNFISPEEAYARRDSLATQLNVPSLETDDRGLVIGKKGPGAR